MGAKLTKFMAKPTESHFETSFLASDFAFSDLYAFKKNGKEKANISTPRYAANPSGYTA